VPAGMMECWSSGILGIKSGRYLILITGFKGGKNEKDDF
jgi:hypothetical protein